MEPVVGIFGSRLEAERAAQRLRQTGLAGDRVNRLSPGLSESEVQSLADALD
jgi:xanthine/CO dehydrogenase XdhC/CoxF family maturation factor